MCRMLALRADDPLVRKEILHAFRSQAHHSQTGPPDDRRHGDGWGIAGILGGRMGHLARSPGDAAQDPNYPPTVERSVVLQAGTVVLAHVRNASKGSKAIENTHPFVKDGWAFCHNGTVHGLNPPWNVPTEGETDSERVFLHLLTERKRGASFDDAIRNVAGRVSTLRHTSLTFLLTDGQELFAYRHVGNEPGSCGTQKCATEYYTLGYGTYKGALVVSQEREYLQGLDGWKEVPDGSLLHVAPGGTPRVRALAVPRVA